MKEKYYDVTSSFFLGIIFLTLGIILAIGKEKTYHYLVSIIVFTLVAKSFLMMIRSLYRKQSNKDNYQSKISALFNLFISLVLLCIPNLPLGFLPFWFSFYLIIIGLSQFAMCFVQIKNGDFLKFSQVVLGIIYLAIAIPVLVEPVSKLAIFLKYFSLYLILLGCNYLYDFLVNILPIKTRNQFKRNIRITLPKVVEAIIPYSVMCEINRNLAIKKTNCYSYSWNLEQRSPDLHILIHTSNRGVNRMGHIDICFNDEVISYGNYDEGSRFFQGFFGDGVLFITNKKADYINFCIDNSKKTIFDFGIILNKKQKERVNKWIEELKANLLPWDCHDDLKYQKGQSYAAKLHKKTKAKFYKFKKGRYKTYFVMGTNCCILVDDIVGKSGMDILSISGVITPGTYYDYLNRELNFKHSNVVSKEIYNYERRAK